MYLLNDATSENGEIIIIIIILFNILERTMPSI
jgi:hypothetical protein